MLKYINKILRRTLPLLALCLSLSLSSQSISDSNKSKMENFVQLISAELDRDITSQEFIDYLETTQENLAMFKSILQSQQDHPNFVAEQVSSLISAMERKLAEE